MAVLNYSLTAKGFAVAVDTDMDLPVHCDVMRIRQALIALLDNALCHATPGPLTIALHHSNGQYQLSVMDAGQALQKKPLNLFSKLFAGSTHPGQEKAAAVV